jgi:hypothetical protein
MSKRSSIEAAALMVEFKLFALLMKLLPTLPSLPIVPGSWLAMLMASWPD